MGKEIKQKCFIEFYERDYVSSTCPGKKDCVSMRNKDASKEKVQKKLLLANISEIYTNFMAEFPSLKIGFSVLLSCSQNGACLLVLLDCTLCVYATTIKM